MVDWQTANTAAFIPPELTTLVSTADGIASSAATVLGTIQAAIDLLSNIVIGIPPFDWLAGLDTLVEDFKNDFFSTGIFALNMWDYPIFQINSIGAVTGQSFASSFEADVIAAFGDEDDPNRPAFTTDASALLLVAGAADPGTSLTALQAVRDAFSWWDEIAQTADQLNRINVETQVKGVEDAIQQGNIVFDTNPSKQTAFLFALRRAMQDAKDLVSTSAFETNIEPIAPNTASTPQEILNFINAVEAEVRNPPYPNFQEISLRTIVPALQETFDRALDPLVATLATGRSITDTIDAFVAALQQKIDSLNNIVNSINTILSQLDNLISLTTLDALFVSTSSGLTGLTSEISAAGNKPLGGELGYYTGVVLVGGGAGLTAFNNLFGPIGGA